MRKSNKNVSTTAFVLKVNNTQCHDLTLWPLSLDSGATASPQRHLFSMLLTGYTQGRGLQREKGKEMHENEP